MNAAMSAELEALRALSVANRDGVVPVTAAMVDALIHNIEQRDVVEQALEKAKDDLSAARAHIEQTIEVLAAVVRRLEAMMPPKEV